MSLFDAGRTILSNLFGQVDARVAADKASAEQAAQRAKADIEGSQLDAIEAGIVAVEATIDQKVEQIAAILQEAVATGDVPKRDSIPDLDIDLETKKYYIDLGVIGDSYTIYDDEFSYGRERSGPKPGQHMIDQLKEGAAFKSFVARCARPEINMAVELVANQSRIFAQSTRSERAITQTFQPRALLIVKLDTPAPKAATAAPKVKARSSKAKAPAASASKVLTTPKIDV